jgi:transposase
MNAQKASAKALLTPLQELVAILDQARHGPISLEQYTTLLGVLHAITWLKEQLQSKRASVKRLLKMIFGTTESARNVLREPAAQVGDKADGPPATDKAVSPGPSAPAPAKKAKGHGRRAAAAYRGAKPVPVPLGGGLRARGPCPDPHCEGTLYAMPDAVQMRFHAAALVQALMYRCERLRCGSCQEVYTAPLPPEAGKERFDHSVAGALALVRYGAGLPFYRNAKLQDSFGVPLAPSTQWDLVEAAANALTPVHEELRRQAGNGNKVHNDDTPMRVLKITQEQRVELLGAKAAKKRTGIFTSGIVAITAEGHQIAEYVTGPRHAGENLAQRLQHRAEGLPPPIHMCDALDANLPEGFETILCRCLGHSRRKFVEVVESFQDEVRVVILMLKEVYKVDSQAHQQNLTAEERLQLHRRVSRPLMIQLALWMRWLLAERLVEPNSGLGQAIRYMRRNWFELTRFYRTPNAPLDNNVVERLLKRAVLHRKNSLFFRTLNGARVADLFMTLIHTAALNAVDAFDYLVTLLRHRGDLAKNPSQWMPWTYRQTSAALAGGGGGPDPPA